MNTAELVDHLVSETPSGKTPSGKTPSRKTSATKKDVAAMLDSTMEGIRSAVARGEKVMLPGFGSFSRTERAARVGRNPQTGEPIQIAACKGVKFPAGAGFKSAVS